MLTMLVVWKIASVHPDAEPDSSQYEAMAAGRTVMKPFAFRVLEPAAVRLFAAATGRSTAEGFLVVGLVSGWVLLCGVLYPVLERRHTGLIILLVLLPFWLRNFNDYFLPDLMHAALCMVYLMFLQKRWWGWASVMLPVMFLTRESTILLAVIAVPALWWLAGRRAGLMQLAGVVTGLAASKFAARHAMGNQHNINDTLYLLGKIPWNLSRNVFGITLWTNTLPVLPPIRVWNVPHWIHLGGIHQIGYSAFDWTYQLSTSVQLLTSFGLGTCVVLCLVLRTPLRRLLPRDEPYLCVAAIYGVIAFLIAPVLGAALTRLFDYGWPLFLVYLPAVMPRIWRNWPVWTLSVLVGLHLISAWLRSIGETYFHFGLGYEFAALLGCNLLALWLLWKASSKMGRESELRSAASA
jgi:hypothetical protein